MALEDLKHQKTGKKHCVERQKRRLQRWMKGTQRRRTFRYSGM